MMNIIKRFSALRLLKLLTILLLLFPQALLSQTMVQGHVFDRQESSIPFANVILLRAVDSTMLAWATTDTLGRFQLNAPQPDLELLIQAGCLGYETMTRPLVDGRMDLAIVLEKKEALLKEVQIVRGKNQYMSFGNNGLSVRLAGSPYLVFTNALDMIQQLPLLSFDDQLKVFGRHGTPLVYINNRLVSDVRKELDGLKSEDIESVDINNISRVKKNRKDSQQVGMRLTYNFGGHKVKYGGSTDSAEMDRL